MTAARVIQQHNDDETSTTPTSVGGADGFHRKLLTEVAKEQSRDSE
jgi:hypothetical protein